MVCPFEPQMRAYTEYEISGGFLYFRVEISDRFGNSMGCTLDPTQATPRLAIVVNL